MEKNERQRRPETDAEGRLAVPLNVQLEIAKQNQRLAEVRWRNLIRRGRAWIEREREKLAPK
jgi:hypothetical protein